MSQANNRVCLLVTVALSWGCDPALAKTRVWVSADKKFEVNAEYVGHDENQVTLNTVDGRSIKVDLAKLSATDKRYVSATTSRSSPQETFELLRTAWLRADWDVVDLCLTDAAALNLARRQRVNDGFSKNGSVPRSGDTIVQVLNGTVGGDALPDSAADQRHELASLSATIKDQRGIVLFDFSGSRLIAAEVDGDRANVELRVRKCLLRVLLDAEQITNQWRVEFEMEGDQWRISKFVAVP